jgi:nucleoside phosphorylase
MDFGVIVALRLEEEAVKTILVEAEKIRWPGSPSYMKGTIEGHTVVLARCSEPGNVSSAIAASDLVRDFDVDYLVLLGIAAGYRGEVDMEDVVFGHPIIGYEYSKVAEKLHQNEPRFFPCDERLVRIAQQLEGVGLEIFPSEQSHKSHLQIAAVASGSKVVASQEFWSDLRGIHRKIRALEMEAEGVASLARHAIPPRPFLVIKGISDFGDETTKGVRSQNTEEAARHDERQRHAAVAAAHVFCQFIQRMREERILVPPRPSLPPVIPPRPPTGPVAPLEKAFLTEKAATVPLKLGELDLQCKLFPPDLWNAKRRDFVFLDDPEAEQQVALEVVGAPLPEHTLKILVSEIEEALTQPGLTLAIDRALLEDVGELLKMGSNPYPRVVAPPRILRLEHTSRPSSIFQILLGPSNFGISLIEERKLKLPTALELRNRYALNSLAVRVGLVYEKEGSSWLEFHQRKGRANATYKGSWDVAAAGYIDPRKHADPEDPDRLSPWWACAKELTEELNLSSAELPYREHYYFLGLGMNAPTGQLDLLAICESDAAPDPNRTPTKKVQKYDRCVLEPEALAQFIAARRDWVPTALLVVILALEAFGFPKERIARSFSPLAGRLNLQP